MYKFIYDSDNFEVKVYKDEKLHSTRALITPFKTFKNFQAWVERWFRLRKLDIPDNTVIDFDGSLKYKIKE